MDYTGILSSASRLKKDSLYKVTISDSTREILLLLNSAIMKAHDAGITKIDFRLPINFRQIDNFVSNAEIQTSVYYNVVTELEKKDYNVKLQFQKKYTLIEVSWSMRAEPSDLERMQAKLMSIAYKVPPS